MAEMDLPTTHDAWRLFILLVVVVALAVGAILAILEIQSTSMTRSGSGSTGPVRMTNKPTYTYACCKGDAVATVYRSGQVLRLGWIRTVEPPGTYERTAVTLTAQVSGPYPSVEDLKRSFVGSHPGRATSVYEATPIRTTLQSGLQPVSVIRLPPGVAPGYYDLMTGTKTPDLSMETGGVIRVEK